MGRISVETHVPESSGVPTIAPDQPVTSWTRPIGPILERVGPIGTTIEDCILDHCGP